MLTSLERLINELEVTMLTYYFTNFSNNKFLVERSEDTKIKRQR
jgi:hypothetical protein